tara:strand:+ start:22804 stop:23907 length:1104 start_codon:yes stop_codon:yes gene_type:complete
LRVTFVLPELNLTGGVRVVGIYAQLLADRGHKVNVLYPAQKRKSFKQKVKFFLKYLLGKPPVKMTCPYFDHQKSEMYELPFHENLDVEDIPDAEIVIATFWSTAEWIAKLPESKGLKVYFIQHYEVHPWLPAERVKQTFKFPFRRIVVSNWIAECLEIYEDVNVDTIVLNGVDGKQFFSTNRGKQETTTVGFMYSPRQYKGTQIAIDAVEIVRKTNPKLRVKVFAAEPPSSDMPLPDKTEFFLSPPQNQIKDIYSGCDAWLFTSIKEGFGLPILEAMSCKTPVIATPAGAATNLITSENGILVDDYSAQQIANAINSISKTTENEWKSLSEAAFATAQQNSWEKSCDKFESALFNMLEAPQDVRCTF